MAHVTLETPKEENEGKPDWDQVGAICPFCKGVIAEGSAHGSDICDALPLDPDAENERNGCGFPALFLCLIFGVAVALLGLRLI